jgi:TRAP-type C4-dicarboxylate transport system substrate-binding protein
MLTGHMQNVLPVFINERTWQAITEKDRTAISTPRRIARTPAAGHKAEQDLVGS